MSGWQTFWIVAAIMVAASGINTSLRRIARALEGKP